MMRVARIVASSPLLLLLACGPKAPAPAPTPQPEPTLDAAHLAAQLTPHVESYGRNWGERRQFSGFVMVAQHDQMLYAHGFGFADRGQQRVPTADTSFRIGSVTKQFTAAAILLLVEDGKLAVGDTIGKHLPGYPAVGAGLTIHQLLTHTSGIPDYTGMDAVMARRATPHTTAELLATFRDQPLTFEPGSKFEYSNSGYIVLGAIIEQASGMSYADFVRTRLFAPAGMASTEAGDATGAADRARGYTPDGDHLIDADPIDMSFPGAAGNVRSTAADMVRWHRALEGDQLLGAASKQLLYTPALEGYAYGWLIGEVDGHPMISHDGGIDGFLTSYLRIPDLDLVVVAWSNNDGVDAGPIAAAALDAALGAPLEPIDEPELAAFDAVAAGRAVGRYAMDEESRAAASALGIPPEALEAIVTMDLTVVDGQLRLKPVGQPEFALEPAGSTRYMQIDIGVTLDVTLPEGEGPATGITVTQGGLTLKFTRVAG